MKSGKGRAMTCLWVKRECRRCGTAQKAQPTLIVHAMEDAEKLRIAQDVGFCSDCGQTLSRDNFRFFVEEDEY